MDEIRVPRCGLEWISGAFGDRTNVFALREVPCGVIFDAIALTATFGKAVLDRLIDERRHPGPVMLDGIRHRVVFLVNPGAEPELDLLRVENRIPQPLPLDVAGLGASVRLPAPVTDQDAPRRWLIAPRSRTPRLTSLEDLATTVGEWVRQRVSRGELARPFQSMQRRWDSSSAVRSAFSA